jgi:hypothetical protein
MGNGGTIRFKASIGIAVLIGILSALIIVAQSWKQKR